MPQTLPGNLTKDILLGRMRTNRQGSFEYQQRRHDAWLQSYQLYRDMVTTNRLTQRQSVNVPLMKETVKTILSRTDDVPDVKLGDLGGDEQREIFCNAYWKHTAKENNLELLDVVDKRQVLLSGRTHMKLNVGYCPGGYETKLVTFEVLDNMDVLVDKYCDPVNIETAKHLIHQHIYRELEEVLANKDYDPAELTDLKRFMATEQGLLKSDQNRGQQDEKLQKLKDLGFSQVDEARLGAVIVELTEHFIKLWEDGKPYIWVAVEAQGKLLMCKPLTEVLGVNFYPFITWADDVEKVDYWTDGTADIIRVPNHILNVWTSQLVENRTLRNFGMNYYDATKENFVPQTFQAQPWGWYGVPGRPQDVVQRVDVPELTESLPEIQYITGMAERASAATAIEKGVSPGKNVTLGEIQLSSAKSNERIVSIAKFYRLARKELVEKWYKIVQANKDTLDPITLYKKSSNGLYFKQKIKPSDCVGEEGVDVTVISSSEQEQMDLRNLSVLQAAAAAHPDNQPLIDTYLHRLLDQAKLTPDEIKEIEDFEKKKRQAPAPGLGGGLAGSLPQQPLLPGKAPLALPPPKTVPLMGA